MLFVDSGAFIARDLPRDRHHREAVRIWKDVAALSEPLCTSTFVVDEVVTYLARRISYRYAAERARTIYASDALTVLRPDEDDEMKALVYFEKFADQKVSFTDCVSFTLMRRRRIERVFAFDHHFAVAGFSVVPGTFPEGSPGWVAETPEPYVTEE